LEPLRAEKQIQEHPVRPEEGFDTRVNIRDRQTGTLIRLQHYAMHTFDDMKMYEQPIGSGNMFDIGGHPIGRWKATQAGKNVRWERISEEHIEAAPAVRNKEEYLEQQNDILRKELEQLRAEQKPAAPKAAAPAQATKK
jgi:hypothetical protein